MSELRDKILDTPPDVGSRPRRREDVILGLLTSAQATTAAAMQVLDAPASPAVATARTDAVDPATFTHERAAEIETFGSEVVKFCIDCGTTL